MGARRLSVTIAMAFSVLGGVARASGDGAESPWYIDQFGGAQPDLDALYAGRPGIVMMRSPRPQLYIAWRLLHGQRVGTAAGAALSIPCCDGPEHVYSADAPPTGVDAWIAARKLVPSAPELKTGIPTERDGANYTSIANCFPEAFDTAASTLKARAADHGATSPAVFVWLTRQDAVFRSCHEAGVTLPGAGEGGPDWLQADEAYQQAALALYDGRALEAADRFAAIARDAKSPWRGVAPYLQARALAREAKAHPSPAAFAKALAALKAVAAAPAGTFGQSQVTGLSRSLEFRSEPARLTTELLAELGRADPPANIAVSFRDLSDLSDKAAVKPEPTDWIATLQSFAVVPDDSDDAARARAGEAARQAGLAHAVERWRAGRDVTWLITALSLANSGELPASVLAAARATPTSSPAWISLRHDLIRLDIAGGADPDGARREVDAVLARTDLSVRDRNVFTAQRLRLATDLHDFAKFALRHRLCGGGDDAKTGCVRDKWYGGYEVSGVYDGPGYKGTVGFGEDARAAIDRMPLRGRMALGVDGSLPQALRLDLAVTNFGRAVQLRDDAAIDALCGQLLSLLSQMSGDWRMISKTPSGPDKRFAVFLALAKIPGVRTDLVAYTRPEGTVPEFQRYWTDWIIPAKGDPNAKPPALALYQSAGFGVSTNAPDAETDLDCLGECGHGSSTARPPAFETAYEARARAERAFFFKSDHEYDKPPPPAPADSLIVWNEMLTYTAAHPADPRVPEALYWLIHVGHYGGSHDHSGCRAFKLLHSRYPNSVWARKARVYND